MAKPLSSFASALLLLFGVACGTASEDVRAEVGTGSDTFVSILEGATIAVVCGPQGGQHIWTAIRTQGLDTQAAHVSLRIRFDDGSTPTAVVCGQQLDGVTLFQRDGWSEVAGVICYVPDPEAVHGKRLRLDERPRFFRRSQ